MKFLEDACAGTTAAELMVTFSAKFREEGGRLEIVQAYQAHLQLRDRQDSIFALHLREPGPRRVFIWPATLRSLGIIKSL